MKSFTDILLPLAVFLAVLAFVAFLMLMYRWARQQKGAAMAFGMLVQMFLPDPKAQQTIEWISESKQEEREKASPSQSDED